MGNKIEGDRNRCRPRSPQNGSYRNTQHMNYSKSAQKDGLYADEKFFENFDSK